MELADHLAEVVPIKVSIDLRCGYGFVTQHLLHGAQVCTAFYEVGGKRVTEGVRADRLLQADACRQAFDNIEYHHPRQLLAPTVEKSESIKSRLNRHLNTDF